MSSESEARFVAKCKCGAKLKVPISAAGRKAKCPKCENIFVIPQHKIEKTAKVESNFDPFDDGTFGLEELAAMEKSAPAIEPTSRGVPCPKCNTTLDGGVMLCMSCGYNRETGKTIKGARTKPSKIASLSKASSKFMLGTIFSGIGALVGAAVWFGIVMATDYEIGWIAWGIGALCGFGMLKGYGKANTRAGLTAAGMSVFGIVAAKAAVFIFVVQAVFTGNTNNIELQREFVTLQFLEDLFQERDIFSDEQREAQWDTTYDEGTKMSSKMNDDEIRNRTIRLRAFGSFVFNDEKSTVGKQFRLSHHRVDIEAEALGLDPFNKHREMMLDAAFHDISLYSPDKLDSAIADLKQWQDTDKWLDTSYVQHQLIYRFVENKTSEKYSIEQAAGNEDWEIDERQWKTFHRNAEAEVKQLSGEDRLAQLRELESADEYAFVPNKLASHYAEIRVQSEGLSVDDNEKRSTIYDEEMKRFSAMSHDELDMENKKLEAWNNGEKWHDANYVYNTLIYYYLDEELQRLRQDHQDDEDYWQPSEADWQSAYSGAKKKTDDMPTHLYQSKVEAFELARTEKIKQMVQPYVDKQTSGGGIADLSDGASTVFMETMWSPMDGLFLLLAVSSAYKIANGSEEAD